MVFSTGQMLGIGAFTAAVLLIGALLLKLDSMIGTNYDAVDGGAVEEADSGSPTSPRVRAAKPRRHVRHR